MSDILARKDGRVLADIPLREFTSKVYKDEPKQDGFPTILKCRWCGGKSREIYVKKFKDGKNGKPVEMVYNYEPCEKCSAEWNNMVVIIEVSDKPPYEDCLPITQEIERWLYPTGRHVGVTPDVARKYLEEEAGNGMVYYMDDGTFEMVFGSHFKA